MLNNLMQGFATAMDPMLLLTLVLSVAAGLIIGAMPGLSATMGVAILIPLTFGMDAEQGLFILIAIFISAVQGGSLPAVLINTPGTPAAAATTFDGYTLAKKGQAGRAIGIAQISSFIGLVISWIILISISPLIAKVALKFGAPEYFAVGLFGLTIVASLSTESLLKGVLAGLFGLTVSCIGLDPIMGMPRLTFGIDYLLGGVSYVPALIGLFAISEILVGVEEIHSYTGKAAKQKDRVIPTGKDLKRIFPTAVRSGLFGTLLGALPGIGSDIAAFFSYGFAKRGKEKDTFGKGNIKGIAAAEAANNGVCGGALIPMLTLGIPGDAVTAIILGSLIIWGINPGSQLFVNNAGLIYCLFAGFIIASVVTLILGMSMAKIFAYVLKIPKKILLPIVMSLCLVGSYSINNSVEDVLIAVIFGIIGYGINKSGFFGSPIVLALILGPMVETNFRRSLVMSGGSIGIFFTRPISLAFLLVAFASIVLAIVNDRKKKAALIEAEQMMEMKEMENDSEDTEL